MPLLCFIPVCADVGTHKHSLQSTASVCVCVFPWRDLVPLAELEALTVDHKVTHPIDVRSPPEIRTHFWGISCSFLFRLVSLLSS